MTSPISRPEIQRPTRRQSLNAAARRYRAKHRDAIKVAENLRVPIAVARSLLARTECR